MIQQAVYEVVSILTDGDTSARSMLLSVNIYNNRIILENVESYLLSVAATLTKPSLHMLFKATF